MANKVSRFRFTQGVDRDEIEAAIAQAIFAAECIHGTSRVRLAVRYHLSVGQDPLCLIETGTQVGEHVARVFTGIMTRRLGEDQFSIECVDRLVEPAGAL